MRVGLRRKLRAEELMLLNYSVGEDSWESFGLQRDPTSPSSRKSVLGVHWKDWCWSWNSNTLATSCEEWPIGKDPDAGRDWGQEEKGMTEDEMAGWHHRLNGHEFEWTPGVGDGQGGLVCCNSWGRKESDRTEQLNWTELNWEKSHFPQLPFSIWRILNERTQVYVSLLITYHHRSELVICLVDLGEENHTYGLVSPGSYFRKHNFVAFYLLSLVGQVSLSGAKCA